LGHRARHGQLIQGNRRGHPKRTCLFEGQGCPPAHGHVVRVAGKAIRRPTEQHFRAHGTNHRHDLLHRFLLAYPGQLAVPVLQQQRRHYPQGSAGAAQLPLTHTGQLLA